ncbi:Hypothetical protein I595_2451 [Croceitalea dokdonensis DOKDO 023]|uniref:STAS domain-containing protein n=1 Tax=Croceitalea dokdonensis DOKDO 023 TaxID=1300341 RepID=A0A0P7ATH8_9FLAO|nr:STAS domain-containing protein [Croceitalea dokdonensis]KPM31187.1 Hypothetical protein I595_2451 [Croceitalea dokdonensis DOKDO 023]
MALEIKEQHGIFEILGTVTSQNLGALSIYFQTVLEKEESIVVNIEGVVKMDSSSALFFEKLYKEAAASHKVVTIVGKQNADIAKIMRMTKTDYILSPDRA